MDLARIQSVATRVPVSIGDSQRVPNMTDLVKVDRLDWRCLDNDSNSLA